MFGEVAPRYDLLNHLLSASLDRIWRRRAARLLRPAGPGPVLDLCSGTGDQAIALARRRDRVVAADFCLPMLALARRKYAAMNGDAPRGLAADALELPFADTSFSAVTVSFGLRNVADLDRSLAELYRVLAPGGRLVVLEFALPRGAVLRGLYGLYFRYLLPLVGRLVSASDTAYDYLPSSVPAFPQRDAFVGHLDRAGFEATSSRDLSGGIVCLYEATRPRAGGGRRAAGVAGEPRFGETPLTMRDRIDE